MITKSEMKVEGDNYTSQKDWNSSRLTKIPTTVTNQGEGNDRGKKDITTTTITTNNKNDIDEEICPEGKLQQKLVLQPMKKFNLPHWAIKQKKKPLQQLKIIKNSTKSEKSN